MPHRDEITVESKTVRMNALSYYHMVELAGLLSAIRGKQISISELTDEMVATLYEIVRPVLIEAVNNPSKRDEFNRMAEEREKFFGGMFKNVKVTK